MPRVDHLVHFRNYVRHNVDKILFMWDKIYKEFKNKLEDIQSEKSNITNIDNL